MASYMLFVKRVTCPQWRIHAEVAFKKQAIKKSAEVLSYYSDSAPKGFCSHTHFVKDMTMTPRDRETPGLCTHYYAALHGLSVLNQTDGVCLRGGNTFFQNKKKKKMNKYYLFRFFKTKFLQLQLNLQQLQQLFVATSTCFTVTLQTVVKIAVGPVHYVRQHGLYFC